VSLGDLALIVAVGLVGPLFAASRRAFVPVVVGEILAGVLLGRSGLDVVHLRLALAVLFGLAWIAQQSGTSVLLGGFARGLVVAAIGGPKRLSTQVRGVAEGFFVPLFFVVLGTRLDVSALVEQPDLLLVTAALIVLNLVIHAVAALATRQPPSAGLIATAQSGVPAAAVQIGLKQRVITPALGAAVNLAALATLALCALGTDLLARRAQPLPAPQEAGPSPPQVAP
jgi:Kef-type K+ transport system membrane component KefB